MELLATLLDNVLDPWGVHLGDLHFVHSYLICQDVVTMAHMSIYKEDAICIIWHKAKINKSSSKSLPGRKYMDHYIGFSRISKQNKSQVPYAPHAQML